MSPRSQQLQIDWNALEEWPENTCYCRCGSVYRSHTKFLMVDDGPSIVARKPCPSCGESVKNLRKVESDPETFTI